MSTSDPCSRVERDADAGLEVERHAFERERLSQHRAHPFAEHQRLAAVGDARQQQTELVAAEARDAVATRAARSRSLPPISWSRRSPLWCPSVSLTSLKRSRSRIISATPLPSRARRQDRLLRAVVEEAAIRQVGQRVVEREVLVLGRLAAQPRRCTRDDPEQRQVEKREARREKEV